MSGYGGFNNQSFGFGRATTTAASTNQQFGTWQNTQQGGSFGFGQPSGFGTPAQTSFGGFGQTSQAGPSNAFSNAVSTPFGSSFQPTGSSGFGFQGAQQKGASSFNTQQSGPFGIAGPSNAPSQATTTTSVPSIDPRLTGTRDPKFEPFKDREPTGVYQTFENITAMEPFRPWSVEELRLYDYVLNRRPGVQQQLVPQLPQSIPSTKSNAFQFTQSFQQQPAQQPMTPFQQPYAQSQFNPTPIAQQPITPSPFVQQQSLFTQQPAQQPAAQAPFAFQQNLPSQTPSAIGALNSYNYQYTGSLYYRLHGTNNPPPLVFETKLRPKMDKGKGKDSTLQLQPQPQPQPQQQSQPQLQLQPQLQPQLQLGLPGTVTSPSPFSVSVGNTSNEAKANQVPNIQIPKVSFSTSSTIGTLNTVQTVSISAPKTPVSTKPTFPTTPKSIITKGSPTILSGTGPYTSKERPKEGDSDNEGFFPEKKTRTTPLPPEESTPKEADFPRRRRREPIYHSGILTPKDIKEPTWGYDKSYRKVVPKIQNIDSSSKDLLEQLKIRDKSVTPSKGLTNTTGANKKRVPGSDVPLESDVEGRLIYELLLRPRRDGPYAYREEYDGTWSSLYGDGRDEKPNWEPVKWKQQSYYREYVKDVKRTKFPITESRYEAPSWWDKHPYKPVPKELTKDMDQYDLSHEAFVEDIVVKMGLRPEPPKAQIEALSRQVIVKIVRVQKKPAEWTETKLINEVCRCCGTLVQKSKEEKMSFDKLYNPLIGGFESQPASGPWVFVYVALPGEFEDRVPTYSELLNKYKSGIPQRNMYFLDEPPRMPRIDFSNIIEGEMEFAKIVKEDVHKICHQDKKCDCPYAKKEPEIRQTQAIPRSHFYCYERLGKKPRENKPTTFETVHGYQPFSKQKTPEPELNKPTKKHRIIVPPQDEDDL